MPNRPRKEKETIIEHLKNTLQSTNQTVSSSSPDAPSEAFPAAISFPRPPSTSSTTARQAAGFYNGLDALPLEPRRGEDGKGIGAEAGRFPADALMEGGDSLQQHRVTDNLRRALSTNDRTNRIGYETVVTLGRQKEIIQHTIENVGETRENLADARRTMRVIRWGVYKDYVWKALVILLLVIWLCLVIYLRFIRRK